MAYPSPLLPPLPLSSLFPYKKKALQRMLETPAKAKAELPPNPVYHKLQRAKKKKPSNSRDVVEMKVIYHPNFST